MAQSFNMPEGLNPFDTPACPTNLSLHTFQSDSTVVSIDGINFDTQANSLRSSDGKGGRSGYIIPTTIDELLDHIENFVFLLNIIFTDSSILYNQWTKILKTVR